MGRPPCCDKVGIKKGPWTPEEDIILVSYIQEHGPGNWRSVPTNTGLLRCSKSCRLRWTNYLRPGIKRGNFTPHEEGMIIHLQALLGNKWAAIASYLPQRTDNDIKNYWNTHLKKKLKKFQSAIDPLAATTTTTTNQDSRISGNHQLLSRSLELSPNGSNRLSQSSSASSSSSIYASSTENISRLLEGWMRTSPKTNKRLEDNINIENGRSINGNCSMGTTSFLEQESGLISNEEFESILSFENLNNVSWDINKSIKGCGQDSTSGQEKENKKQKKSENNDNNNNNPPLSFLEKWLLDENGNGQVDQEAMEVLSPIF